MIAPSEKIEVQAGFGELVIETVRLGFARQTRNRLPFLKALKKRSRARQEAVAKLDRSEDSKSDRLRIVHTTGRIGFTRAEIAKSVKVP